PVRSAVPSASESRTNLAPVGPTSSTSMSPGNVCVICFSVTETLATAPVNPAIVIVGGYGVAGAPDVAPVPVAGTTIAAVFEKVWAVSLIVPSVGLMKQNTGALAVAGGISA